MDASVAKKMNAVFTLRAIPCRYKVTNKHGIKDLDYILLVAKYHFSRLHIIIN